MLGRLLAGFWCRSTLAALAAVGGEAGPAAPGDLGLLAAFLLSSCGFLTGMNQLLCIEWH